MNSTTLRRAASLCFGSAFGAFFNAIFTGSSFGTNLGLAFLALALFLKHLNSN